MTDDVPELPEGAKHGTYSTYFRRKCRCEECRAYQRERVAKNRADRLARGVVHGSRSSYDAGCRCIPCLKARRKIYPRENAVARQKAAKARQQETKENK